MINKNGALTDKVKNFASLGGTKIADELRKLHPESSKMEYRSWENSIPQLLGILMEAGLGDLEIIFELETPLGVESGV